MNNRADLGETALIYRQILTATDRLLRYRGRAEQAWREGGEDREAMASELQELGRLMCQVPDSAFKRHSGVNMGGLREYANGSGSFTPWGLIDQQVPLVRQALIAAISPDPNGCDL